MGNGIFVSKWISLYLHTLFMHVGKCKLQKCPERGALGQWQYGKIKIMKKQSVLNNNMAIRAHSVHSQLESV